MCLEPGRLPNGQFISCRKCKQCLSHHQMDWEGKCIAESKVVRRADFVCLTYGRVDVKDGKPVPYYVNEASADHVRAAVLTYSDVQKFFKKLRSAGHKFRYFAVGEYGSTKGRSHWHILMYWISVPPKVTFGVRFDWSPWEHGFSQFDPISYADVRYCCKYIEKDWLADESQAYFATSKNPPLGHRWFQRLARQYVDQGLAPQDLIYTFPECVTKKGDLVRFRMRDATANHFIRSYVDQWAELRPNEHMPWSSLVDTYQDRWTRKEKTHVFDLAIELDALAQKPVRQKAERPWLKAPLGAVVSFQEPLNTWVATTDEGAVFYWSYDEEGERAWMLKSVVAESDAEKRRLSVSDRKASRQSTRGYAKAYRQQSNGG